MCVEENVSHNLINGIKIFVQSCRMFKEEERKKGNRFHLFDPIKNVLYVISPFFLTYIYLTFKILTIFPLGLIIIQLSLYNIDPTWIWNFLLSELINYVLCLLKKEMLNIFTHWFQFFHRKTVMSLTKKVNLKFKWS